MKMQKKALAAVAAVTAYIKTEEEICAAQAAAQTGGPAGRDTPPKLWGVSGRQHQMQLRTNMQLKAYHRSGR